MEKMLVAENVTGRFIVYGNTSWRPKVEDKMGGVVVGCGTFGIGTKVCGYVCGTLVDGRRLSKTRRIVLDTVTQMTQAGSCDVEDSNNDEDVNNKSLKMFNVCDQPMF